MLVSVAALLIVTTAPAASLSTSGSGGSERAPSWIARYIEVIGLHPTSTQPSTLLPPSQYAAALASFKRWSPRGRSIEAARIRDRLLALNPAWARTLPASGLPFFTFRVCHGYAAEGATSLMAWLPGAGLPALPLLNRALMLVPKTCPVPRPALLDVAGNIITRRLLLNHAANPIALPTEERSSGNAVIDAANKGICTGLQHLSGRRLEASLPFARWLINRLRSPGRGGLFLSVASAGAWTACPKLLGSVLHEAGYSGD
jgi:hypothetical protein